MTTKGASLPKILDRLEEFHGPQEPCWPTDPYLFLVWWYSGYPASDKACTQGYDSLKKNIGLDPERLLRAPIPKMAAALKPGGMLPELRAERLKELASRVTNEFGGDLRAALAGPLNEARKKLKTFHSIADPGADRILLFAGLAPLAAVPSNCVHVPDRIRNGQESSNYSRAYREAQQWIEAEIPAKFDARMRAYLLLKQHGQEICKRTNPKCSECPVKRECSYFSRRSQESGDRSQKKNW